MKVRASTIALVLVLALASASLVAAQGTVVFVEPALQEVYVGDPASVEVWASDVTEFYGAQFELTFDDTILEGVSVEPGSAFTDFSDPDEYDVAVAEIVSDTVSFAATLLRVPKAGPITGDVQLAIITFNALAEGSSPLALGEVKLSNVAGEPIAFVTEDGQIDVVIPPTELVGAAYMEGRTDHSGILVTLMSSPVMTATTDASGAYSFADPPTGVYSLTMEADLYLSAMATDVEILENESNVACDVTLLGGDIAPDPADDVIDILDLAQCAADFDTAAAASDINADGIVDVYDLVLIGKNFKLEGPDPVVSCAP